MNKIWQNKFLDCRNLRYVVFCDSASRTENRIYFQNFETTREQSPTNGYGPGIPSFDPTIGRSVSPLVDESFVVAREDQSRIEETRQTCGSPSPEPRIPSPAPIINVNVHRPATPPPPVPHTPTADHELAIKLAEAQEEIQRLRQLLAQTPDLSEVRRRGIRSDETVVSTEDVQSEAGTCIERHSKNSHLQEGASPQQVGIIALLVFVITYLFF